MAAKLVMSDVSSNVTVPASSFTAVTNVEPVFGDAPVLVSSETTTIPTLKLRASVGSARVTTLPAAVAPRPRSWVLSRQ